MSGMYDHQWRKARAAFLMENPFCRMHEERGAMVLATVVDHIVPHRGDHELFWDQSNWQPLCDHCHNSHKQRHERNDYQHGSSLDGTPTDPNHHWNV